MEHTSRKGFAPLWSLIVLAVLAFSISGYAVIVYLTGRPLESGFVLSKEYFENFVASSLWTTSVVIHAAGGAIALAAGAVQWIATRLPWRRKRPQLFRRVHIATGLTYTSAIVVSAATGFVLAREATGGLPSVLGFGVLDLLWILTTLVAAILGNRLRKIGSAQDMPALRARHRAWMLRSYSLTAAAITLRIWLVLSVGLLQLEFVPSYQVISWLCWVPNLVVAELIIRTRPLAKIK